LGLKKSEARIFFTPFTFVDALIVKSPVVQPVGSPVSLIFFDPLTVGGRLALILRTDSLSAAF
jgi:hypothetical protein